jgi:hypothetical protein
VAALQAGLVRGEKYFPVDDVNAAEIRFRRRNEISHPAVKVLLPVPVTEHPAERPVWSEWRKMPMQRRQDDRPFMLVYCMFFRAGYFIM